MPKPQRSSTGYSRRDCNSNSAQTTRPNLTEAQVLLQCKMYIAALRIADDFGCHAIGIQYQQGLKDLLPASDLVEGMLNNSDRPPVSDRPRQAGSAAGAAAAFTSTKSTNAPGWMG